MITGPAAVFRATNHLHLIAFSFFGLLLFNVFSSPDWICLTTSDYGDVAAISGYYNEHTGAPGFSNFNVWTPQQ